MKKYYRDALFDLRTSVNKNVALSILIGLRSSDPVRPNNDPRGDPLAAHQGYLESLDVSVFELISEARDKALNKLDDAMEGENQDEKDRRKLGVVYFDDLMRQTHRHLCDINYELAKGEKSMLKVDHAATKSPDDQYIEVASLDEWAMEKYKINIFDTRVNQPPSDDTLGQAEIQEEEDASQLRPDVGKVKTNNLYILLAFFVEAFASTASGYRDKDEPNASIIAEHFEAVVKAANNKNALTAHTAENIRKVIAEAMLRKKQKQLKKSYVNGVLQPIVLPKPSA